MKINKLKNKIATDIKKQKIKKHIIKSSRVVHKVMILQLISDGNLDNIIYKLNNKIVEVNCNCLEKKGYISSEEHFIYIIDNFITYFLNIFNYSDMTKEIVSLCINSDCNNIFTSKEYLFNNDNIEYYRYNYNLIIVNNFYNNCLILQKDLEQEFANCNLNIKKIDIKNNDSILKLVMLLEELNFVNKNYFAQLSLFKKIDKNNYKYYLNQWQSLFLNFFDNQELILEYRKFKEKNNI